MALMSLSMMATPKYLVQATYVGTEPTWSQATIDATGATVIDLATVEKTLDEVITNDEIWIIEGTYYWLKERSPHLWQRHYLDKILSVECRV